MALDPSIWVVFGGDSALQVQKALDEASNEEEPETHKTSYLLGLITLLTTMTMSMTMMMMTRTTMMNMAFLVMVVTMIRMIFYDHDLFFLCELRPAGLRAPRPGG